jgi:hypothetical protein
MTEIKTFLSELELDIKINEESLYKFYALNKN